MSRKHYICEFLINCLVVLHLNHWNVEAYRPNNYTLIELINSRNLTWRAGVNPTNVPDPSPAREPKESALPVLQRYAIRTPHTFDARSHWPHCSTIIDRIRDQGECSSCWAVAAASVLSDRMCIQSNGHYKLHLSAEDVMTCCSYCPTPGRGGCEGGHESRAMKYWSRSGIVTGGEVGSGEGCKPYSRDSFKNINKRCTRSCTNGDYGRTYFKDKYKGTTAYRVPSSEDVIKSEIFQYGPVTAGMKVFDDFHQYRGGVYVHVTGRYISGHAVRIIGWGVESDVKYWLVANSHGKDYGLQGYMKILRGVNHCEIERDVGAASLYRGRGKWSSGKRMRQADIVGANKGNSILMEKSLLYAFCAWVLIKPLKKNCY